MEMSESQKTKARREGFKNLITPMRHRDTRLEILQAQAMQFGWEPPGRAANRDIPTFPFVFSWTEEQMFEIRPCRWAGQRRAVWQPHKPNMGRPEFTNTESGGSAFHVVRMRKAVMEDLCTVCGQSVDTSGVLWMNIISDPLMSDDGWASLRFPLFHLECIQHALNGCPFLRAGFGGFAPYRGKIRKQAIALNAEGLSNLFGLRV